MCIVVSEHMFTVECVEGFYSFQFCVHLHVSKQVSETRDDVQKLANQHDQDIAGMVSKYSEIDGHMETMNKHIKNVENLVNQHDHGVANMTSKYSDVDTAMTNMQKDIDGMMTQIVACGSGLNQLLVDQPTNIQDTNAMDLRPGLASSGPTNHASVTGTSTYDISTPTRNKMPTMTCNDWLSTTTQAHEQPPRPREQPLPAPSMPAIWLIPAAFHPQTLPTPQQPPQLPAQPPQAQFQMPQQQPFMPIHALAQQPQPYVNTNMQVDINPFVPPPGSQYTTPTGYGLFGAPQVSSIKDLADVAADTVDKPWKITRKGLEDLPKFGGELEKFQGWKKRFINHASMDNARWTKLLRHAAECPCDISPQWLLEMKMDDYTGADIARELYLVIGKTLREPIYDRMKALAGGCEGNGFQLWRELFREFEGGDPIVQNNLRVQFHAFKQCKDINKLGRTLDDWFALASKVGQQLDDEFLRTMLVGILPEDLKADCNKRMMLDLGTSDKVFKFAKQQVAHLRSEQLADHSTKPVHQLTQQQQQDQANNIIQALADAGLVINPQGVIQAVTQPPPRPGSDRRPPRTGTRTPPGRGRPGARPGAQREPYEIDRDFKGCWHCGALDHSRGGCKQFIDLCAANGGRPPPTYKGKYERFLENKKKSAVGAVVPDTQNGDSDDSDTDEEGEEAVSQCTLFPRSYLSVVKSTAPSRDATITTTPPPLMQFTRETFKDINRNKKLTKKILEQTGATTTTTTPISTQHSIKITTASDKARLQKERKNKDQKMYDIKTDADIDMICNIIKKKMGKVNLAAVTKELEKDKGNKHLLACVDSGSVAAVLDAEKEVPGHPVVPSKGQKQGLCYESASGSKIANEGKVKLQARNPDGVSLPPMSWQNAKVKMPILSVRRMVRKGARVEFFKRGGIIHLPDERKINFIEKFGVYFVHLLIDPPDGTDAPGFTRHGS